MGSKALSNVYKLHDVVNVKDPVFGAKLDGTTDDASAFQAAIDSMDGLGVRIVAIGASCNIATGLDLENKGDFTLDFAHCTVTFNGSAGDYLFDCTQGHNIAIKGGAFTGTTGTHFLKGRGSAAAQATTYPTIPSASEWTHDILVAPHGVIQGFATVFDLENFTREVQIERANCSGNTTALKLTGKVVNVCADDCIFYSTVASSQSLLCRGDSGDTTYRYAEGIFLSNCICDVQGIAVDVRDAYVLRVSGGQIKSASGVTGCDIRKGVTALTQDLFFQGVLFNSAFVIGNGLATNFLFQAKLNACVFSGVAGTSITTAQYTQGFTAVDISFDAPTGAKRAVAIGADNVAIHLDDLHISSDHTTKVAIDSTSYVGVTGHFPLSFTPGVAFGGGTTGITYTTQAGGAQWNGRFVEGCFEIVLSSKGTDTGAAIITGLPVPAVNKGAACVGDFASFNSAFTPVLGIATGASVITVKTGAGGSTTAFTDADFSNTSQISGTFKYQVS